MTLQSREQAQQRIDQIHAFRRELDELQNEQVMAITAAQRDAITNHHDRLIRDLAAKFDADVDERGRQLSLTMRIMSFAGAILVSSTVFLLFYHFWASLALGSQIILLIVAPLATFVIALIVQSRDPTGYFSRLAAALCFACFVLNVVILPPLLNLSVGALPVLASGAFAVVLGYGMESGLLLSAGVVGVFIYCAALLTQGLGAPWWAFAMRPENFLAGAAIVLGAAAVPKSSQSDFPSLYRAFGCLGVFVPLLMISAWPALSYWPATTHLSLYYQLLTLLAASAAIYLGLTRGWAEVTLLGVIAAICLLTERIWIWLLSRLPLYQAFVLASAIAIAALLAIAVVRSRRRPLRSADEI